MQAHPQQAGRRQQRPLLQLPQHEQLPAQLQPLLPLAGAWLLHSQPAQAARRLTAVLRRNLATVCLMRTAQHDSPVQIKRQPPCSGHRKHRHSNKEALLLHLGARVKAARHGSRASSQACHIRQAGPLALPTTSQGKQQIPSCSCTPAPLSHQNAYTLSGSPHWCAAHMAGLRQACTLWCTGEMCRQVQLHMTS